MTLGVVVIGRNEGERLRRCLDSVLHSAQRVVYVDSGSTDHSVALARAKGAAVVELDAGVRFTAARARNEGFRRLRQLAPDLVHVQFIDGDCELADGWLHAAAAFLARHPGVAAVCGQLREKYPRQTVYNMLCNIEWDTALGEAKACGGIAMMRAGAFESVGGYRAEMIAGEEPELCIRLRARGWSVWRLPQEMALHDAAMSRFGQWWMRMLRTGYAFALGAHLHGAPPERHGVRESRSAWLWGCGLPILALGCMAWVGPWGALLFALYPAQVVRLALRGGRSTSENWWRALFLVLGKFPEFAGQLRFLSERWFGGQSRLIEHK